MSRKFNFLVSLFKSGNSGKGREKTQNIEYLKNEKSFSNKIKTIVLKWFLLAKYKT